MMWIKMVSTVDSEKGVRMFLNLEHVVAIAVATFYIESQTGTRETEGVKVYTVETENPTKFRATDEGVSVLLDFLERASMKEEKRLNLSSVAYEAYRQNQVNDGLIPLEYGQWIDEQRKQIPE